MLIAALVMLFLHSNDIAAVPESGKVFTAAVAGHYEHVTGSDAPSAEHFSYALRGSPGFFRSRTDSPALRHYHLRRVAVGLGYTEVAALRNIGGGLFHNGNAAGRLDYCELHLADVENVLTAQGGHEVVRGEAELPQYAGIEPAAAYDYLWTAGDKAAQARTFQAYPRDDDLEADEGEDRRDADDEGDIRVLDRKGGDVRDEYRNNELGGLEFAELALAHEPDGEYNEDIEHDCPYYHDCQTINSFNGYCFPESRGYAPENAKAPAFLRGLC